LTGSSGGMVRSGRMPSVFGMLISIFFSRVLKRIAHMKKMISWNTTSIIGVRFSVGTACSPAPRRSLLREHGLASRPRPSPSFTNW
jgi:hypothetical protein